VIVAFLDRDDGLNEVATAALGELATEGRLLASAVTFSELLTGAHLLHQDEALVRGFFDDLIAVILPVDVATVERAAELRSGHRSRRMPDALILAAADLHPEVETLLTGDAGLAAVDGIGCKVDLLG
jgi:predicted nucleic acid-binding protein